jgi:hypothetical protein
MDQKYECSFTTIDAAKEFIMKKSLMPLHGFTELSGHIANHYRHVPSLLFLSIVCSVNHFRKKGLELLTGCSDPLAGQPLAS